MTSELIGQVAEAISEARTGNSLSWRHYVAEAKAAIAAMQADAAPVAWQVRCLLPNATRQWQTPVLPSLLEAVRKTGKDEAGIPYEYRPLYAYPPVADLAQLRAELEAAHEVIAEQLEIRQRNEAKLAKFKALAETLAGALELYAQWGGDTAREALRQYKEARDAS